MLGLAACAGATGHARRSAHDDLSAIQTAPAQLPGAHSGAPTDGLIVSGRIANPNASVLRCRSVELLLVAPNGDATAPSEEWCDLPQIAPNGTGYFSAIFPAPSSLPVQLRFEHPDGSYEAHALNIPPA